MHVCDTRVFHQEAERKGGGGGGEKMLNKSNRNSDYSRTNKNRFKGNYDHLMA